MTFEWLTKAFGLVILVIVVLGNTFACGFETGHNEAERKFAPCDMLAYERAGKDLPERCK